MKTVLALATLSMFWATQQVLCDEAPAVTVAIVRMDRVMNNGNFYERARLLFGNKEVIEAIRKTNDEIKTAYAEVIKTEDQVRLAELENRLQFLKRKVNILRQGIAEGGRDMQGPFREFVTKTYGSKYPIILQDMNAFDRCISKRVEVVDLSDEAAEKFRVYVDELVGDEPIPPTCLRSSIGPATIDHAAAQKAAEETAARAKAAAVEKAAADKALAEKATAEMEAAKKAAAQAEAAQKAAENAKKQ